MKWIVSHWMISSRGKTFELYFKNPLLLQVKNRLWSGRGGRLRATEEFQRKRGRRLGQESLRQKQRVLRSGRMIRMKKRHYYGIAKRTQRWLPEKGSLWFVPGKNKCFPLGKNVSGGGIWVGWAQEIFHTEKRILRARSWKVQHGNHSMMCSV